MLVVIICYIFCVSLIVFYFIFVVLLNLEYDYFDLSSVVMFFLLGKAK